MLKLPNALLVSEAAEKLGCSDETLYREIRRGNLDAKPRKGMEKPMYIALDELERWKMEVFGEQKK